MHPLLHQHRSHHLHMGSTDNLKVYNPKPVQIIQKSDRKKISMVRSRRSLHFHGTYSTNSSFMVRFNMTFISDSVVLFNRLNSFRLSDLLQTYSLNFTLNCLVIDINQTFRQLLLHCLCVGLLLWV